MVVFQTLCLLPKHILQGLPKLSLDPSLLLNLQNSPDIGDGDTGDLYHLLRGDVQQAAGRIARFRENAQ